MTKLSPRLELLDKALLALSGEVMLLSELDGLIAGVVTGPEFILPGEWLPQVWGGERAPGKKYKKCCGAR